MPVLTFPAIVAKNNVFGLRSNTMAFSSPMNRDARTKENPGAAWFAAMEFSRSELSRADMRALAAFLAQLRGMSGRFYLYDHAHPTPLGTPGGTPLVNGVGQTGVSLITDGWIASTNIFAVGDYFQVGDELKIITAPVTSDSLGNATLTFEPPLRVAPADNAAIVWDKPKCIMRLSSDDQAQWRTEPPLRSTIVLDCVEAFTV